MNRITSLSIVLFVVALLAACNNVDETSLEEGSLQGVSIDFGGTLVEQGVNNTIYQAFYWDAYPGLWKDLPTMAKNLAEAGITSMWLPPAAKTGLNRTGSVGYDPYDIWDLGEFNQKGGSATRYGTRSELDAAIKALRDLGIEPYFDVVFNHRMGADNQESVRLSSNSPNRSGQTINVWTDYSIARGRSHYYTAEHWGWLHHDFNWNWQAFNATDWNQTHNEEGLFVFNDKSISPVTNNTFGNSYLMGSDVDYTRRQDIRDEMNAWGEWIVNHVGFAGFRMDAIQHVDSDFVDGWLDHVQEHTGREVFFVGEAWTGDLVGYINHVKANPNMRVFDFPLRDDFVGLSNGNKDMRNWGGLSNHSDRAMRQRAVTFVDNHDTSRDGNEYNQPQIVNYKHQAYAYILMREDSIPTVYARDYDEFDMAAELDKLISVRRNYAYGPGHEVPASTSEVYAYVREGSSSMPGSGAVMLISGRDSGGTTSLTINSRQPDTTFVDFTGNVTGTVTTDGAGNGEFSVQLTEATGWSVWVPQQ